VNSSNTRLGLRFALIALGGICFGAGLAWAEDPRDRGADTVDVSSFPPKYQQLYSLFAVKCSKCHSLARPINARLQADDWRLYVKKMKRRQGSGINDAIADDLTDFLVFFAGKKK